jgi:hypothetical protein
MAQSSGVHPSAFLEVPMPSAVVLSGQTTAEDLAAETEETLPDYTLERIDQLVPARLWEELGWENTLGHRYSTSTGQRKGELWKMHKG